MAFIKNQAGRSSTAITGAEEIIPSPNVATANPEIQDMVNPESQVNLANDEELAHQDGPSSPVRASIPIMEVHEEDPKDDPAAAEPETKIQDDVVVTGENYNPDPKTSTALTKLIAKDESPNKDKGKASLHLQSFEALDVNSLQPRYMTRLSESRDAEMTMVNTLKIKYEVIPC